MAIGDILSVTITDKTTAGYDTDGWFADIVLDDFVDGGTYDWGLAANNDPAGAKVVFTVTSEGYDAEGTLGTITRTVYGTRVLRKAYPNQAQMQETESGGDLTVRIALSDVIYDDDKNGGAGTSGTDVSVSIGADWYTDDGAGGSSNGNNAFSGSATNNSTADYPQVIGRWATVPYQRVTSDILLEVVAFHKGANNGKPVARVEFEAGDQSTNTVTGNATSMATSAWDPGDGSSDAVAIPVYAATLSTSGLDDTEVIDCNFKIYPWLGDADSILDSRVAEEGVAQPDERMGPLHCVNDKGGTLLKYAAVDSVSGDDGTGVVSAVQATAEATPFLTIEGAATDAGWAATDIQHIILKNDATHSWTAFTPAGTANTWCVIKPKTNATIGGGENVSCGQKIAIHGCTITTSATGALRGTVATAMIWLHNLVDINQTGTAPLYQWRGMILTRIQTGTDFQFSPFSSSRSPIYLMRGCDLGVWSSGANNHSGGYCVIGNKKVTFDTGRGAATDQAPQNNGVYAYNECYSWPNASGPLLKISSDEAVTYTGYAIVGNIMECINADTQPLMQLMADSANQETAHFCVWHNTIVGARCNVAYNDTAANSDPHINWSMFGNLLGDCNIKADVSAADGGNVGCWPVLYQAGCQYNQYNIEEDATAFPYEFDGLYSTDYPTAVTFADNQSYEGSGGGDGDYTPADGTYTKQAIAAADQVLPSYDSAGAVQIASDIVEEPSAIPQPMSSGVGKPVGVRLA